MNHHAESTPGTTIPPAVQAIAPAGHISVLAILLVSIRKGEEIFPLCWILFDQV